MILAKFASIVENDSEFLSDYNNLLRLTGDLLKLFIAAQKPMWCFSLFFEAIRSFQTLQAFNTQQFR